MGGTEWNRAKQLCVIFYGNRALLVLCCLHCSLFKALYRENSWNSKCIVDSSWKEWVHVTGCKRACGWLQRAILHWNKAVPMLPILAHCAFLTRLARRLCAHPQHWQGRGWHEVTLVLWRAEALTRCLLSTRGLLPWLLPGPQPMLERGCGQARDPAQRLMSAGGNFIQWHCSCTWFAELVIFSCTLFVS